MATSMYLKFENPDVKGASTAPGHVGEIEVLSWSHGYVQPVGRSGSSRTETFSFSKYLDSATDGLQKQWLSGQQFGKVTLICLRADGANDNKPVEYLTVVMAHVVIENCTMSGGPGDIPVENYALGYGTIQYNYKEQKHSD